MLLKSLNYTYKKAAFKIKRHNSAKNEDKCSICQIMRIKNDYANILKWIFTLDKTLLEKKKLASFLTNIEFDDEILECLNDPVICKMILHEQI